MREYLSKYGKYGIVMMASSFLFIAIYGVHILDVTYVEWLLSGGDLTQHYIGWKFFRIAPWQNMIGMMNNIAYPFSESIIYTDSIPLAAVLCKLLREILPTRFQYFGIWGLICFVLQGLMAALILNKYLKNNVQIIMGSLFFVLAPVMLRRMYWHTSLSAHFIILLAIALYLYHDQWFKEWWKSFVIWGAMGLLCASVHIYYVPMCGVILLGFVILNFMSNHKVVAAIVPLIAYMLCALFMIWWLGGFSSGMDDGAPGLGYYSFNLNGFFNPQDWSSFFKGTENYAGGQYEGFAYVGSGIIVLVIISVVFIVWHLRKKNHIMQSIKEHRNVLVSTGMCIVIVFMSASNEISLGDNLLFKLPLSKPIESIWSVFRASGRLIWPAVYMLMIFAICTGVRAAEKSKRVWSGTAILAICLLLQVFELKDKLVEKRAEFSRVVTAQNQLEDAIWTSTFPYLGIEAVVFADKEHLSQEELYVFSDYASNHDMTINDFYFARALEYRITDVAQDFLKHPNNKTIYLFSEDEWWSCNNYELHYYLIDNFIIGLQEPLNHREEVNLSELAVWFYRFEGQYISGGEDIDGVRYLHEGGVSYGPYKMVPDGEYFITIEGEGLEKTNLLCYYDGSMDHSIEMKNLVIKSDKVCYQVSLEQEIKDLEIVIQNASKQDVIIRRIQIQKIGL